MHEGVVTDNITGYNNNQITEENSTIETKITRDKMGQYKNEKDTNVKLGTRHKHD
jgi:hypothetical protein